MFRTSKKKKSQNSRRQFRTSQGKDEEEGLPSDLGNRPSNDTPSNTDNDKRGDDDDDDPTIVVRRTTNSSKKRKGLQRSGGMIVRSFNMDEDGDDNKDNDDNDDVDFEGHRRKRKKKRKRKGGLGFGGGFIPSLNDEDDEMMMDEKQEAEQDDAQMYGKKALEQLKLEQRQRPPDDYETKVEDNSAPIEMDTATPKVAATRGETSAGPTMTRPLPSFMPLNEDQQEPAILTGEEAIQFQLGKTTESEEEEKTSPNRATGLNDNSIDRAQSLGEDDGNDWEDQIVRRAGLSSIPTTASTRGESSKQTKYFGDIPSLTTLKEQLESTVSNLKVQHDDLESALTRRQAELAQCESDVARHKQSLQDSGSAFDYYQQLRLVMTAHVGALRDLQKKIQPTCDALLNLIVATWDTRQQRVTEWQDDVASLLREANLLDRVIGRQPKSPDNHSLESAVDEFGRDVQSLYMRQRDKRYQQRVARQRGERQREQQQDTFLNKSDVDSNTTEEFVDTLWRDDQEVNAWMERYLALQEAVRVTLDDVDEEYASLPRLLQVFREWRQSRPDEYHQCYANLSLADLASIHVCIDLCRSTWLSNMTLVDAEDSQDDSESEHQDHTAKLLAGVELLEAYQKEDQTENEDDMGGPPRALEKCIIPFLMKLIDHPQSLIFSPHTSFLLSRSVSSVIERLQGTSSNQNVGVLIQIEQGLNRSLDNALEGLSMPIVTGGAEGSLAANQALTAKQREQVAYALANARGAQVDFVKQALMSLLEYWIPVLKLLANSKTDSSEEPFITTILDFVSNKFLFLLSSLPQRHVATTMFRPIWQILNQHHRDWLNSPQHFLQAAPIRAAAVAYGL